MAGPSLAAIRKAAPKERAKLRAMAHGHLAKPPRTFEAEGFHFELAERMYVPGRGLWVALTSKDAEVDPDGYFFPEPPVLIQPGDAEANVEEAFRRIVGDAAFHYHSHPEVWGRTTTTFFASSVGGYVSSTDAVYATARTSGTLAADDGLIVRIGQTTGYVCNEGFVKFNTSSIPDDDAISSATLSLDGVSDDSTTDFIAEARLQDWGTGLQTSDWVSGADLSMTLLATWDSAGYVAGYNDFTENGSNLRDSISKTGDTRILINSDRHRLGTAPTTSEVVEFNSADAAGTTEDPRLVVNHSPAEMPGGTRSRSIQVAVQQASRW
ncbi:MAG: hypothetical protein ACRDH9_03060 [Actinomycetota bacterium]